MKANKIILIDSKDLQNISNVYTVPSYANYNNKLIRINKIIVPYTFYNIDSTNNLLKTSAGNVSVPTGFYDIDTLTTYIQTALKVFDASFTCTYSLTSFKITIARTTNFNLTLSTSTINDVLGFLYVDKTGAASYTGTNIYDIGANNIITFHSELLSKVNSNQHSDSRKNFILDIPITVSPGQKIIYSPYYPTYFKLDAPKNYGIDKMYFMSEKGNIINFNGNNWKLELEIIED